MTDDYRKNLLDYITNNLQTTSPTTDEIFKEVIEANRSDWVDYLPSGWANFKFEGLISANENTSNLNILYGGYYTTGNQANAKGVIILLDVNFKPIKAFYKYASGTDLRYIQKMEQAEDNTFYFIDDTYYAPTYYDESQYQNGTRRFVMVNNFSVQIENEYRLDLRTSYIFGANYNNFYCKDMYKDPNSSHYVFLGKYTETYRNTKTISLKINVGEANEWEYINSLEYEYAGGFVNFDNDSNYYVRMVLNQVSALRNYFIMGVKNYNSNTYTYSQVGNFNYYFDIDTEHYDNQIVFINQNEAYFVGNNQVRQIGPENYDKYIGLYYYNFSTSTIKTIYEEFIENAKAINKRAIYINKLNNEIYVEFNTNINTTDNTADYYVQRLVNDEWDPIFIANNYFIYNQRAIYINSKYNLLTIQVIANNPRRATWYNLQIKEIYNQNQYNGESYINTDVFVPKYANLYAGNSIVFSRNLFNITKQSNTTMSSVSIPSNYLNDTTITKNDLISKTNFAINSDNTSWNKNIYEVVDLNFINTISVMDEDTNTPYLESAIKINNATTDGGATNYANTPCIKYRINYLDNTSTTGTINWVRVDNTHKQTTITLHVDKAINSIDFISNDGSVIYLRIIDNFIVDNDYTIKQKLRIE